MTDLSASNATSPQARLPASRAWRAGLFIGVAALAANLLVLAGARLAGATMTVEPPGQEPQVVGAGMVIPMTLVPVLAGTAVLIGLRGRGLPAWRTMASVGLLLGVVTIVLPLTMATEVWTGITLSSMHLITGMAWFVGVRRTQRTQDVR